MVIMKKEYNISSKYIILTVIQKSISWHTFKKIEIIMFSEYCLFTKPLF